jgi:hypothetical protein
MTLSGLQSRAVTDPGTKRRLNEDCFLNRPEVGLWAVADGVGGASAGEVASAAVCDALATIQPGLSGDQMLAEVRERLQTVHHDLMVRAAGGTIASTVVVLIVAGPYFACLWAGDSRVYLLHDGLLRRLTRDHSLVQAMVDDGHLTEAEAENHPRSGIGQGGGRGPGRRPFPTVQRRPDESGGRGRTGGTAGAAGRGVSGGVPGQGRPGTRRDRQHHGGDGSSGIVTSVKRDGDVHR